MSLPEASKAVTENPTKNSITTPTNKNEQEKDIDRKLRLYGVIQAFSNGRMPDNAQIDETLVFVRDHSPVNTNQLSAEGRKLIQDVRNIVETSRLFVQQKNADEVIQQFFYHTSGAQFDNKKATVDTPVSEKQARKDVQEALSHLRNLFHLLVTNSEARKLLSDFKLIGRGLFADAAANVAERARPDPESMANVDNPVPMSNFDETSTTAQIPSAGEAEANDESSKRRMSNPPDELKSSDRAATAAIEGTTEPAKKSFGSRFRNFTSRVPDKHKERANAEMEFGRKYIKEQFPKERRDQFVYRLKKVVVECQSHPEYQKSLSWFLTQIENYFAHGKRTAETGANQTTSFFSDPLLQQASSEARIFLERCADGQNMDGMISAARQLWEDAQNDEDLRAWWRRVDVFVQKSLLEPGFILAPMFDSQARQLRDESRQFFDVKYKASRDNFVNAVQAWFRAWGEDPLNKRFGNDWSTLVKDLLFNETGDLTYKPQLWADVRHVILPELTEKVGYVPIPRIEYTDEDFDLVIENLTLQGRNLFPNILEVDAQNYFKISPYKTIKDQHQHKVTLTLSQIQADMRDVAFYYRKKGGLRISDSGLADVFLGGKGITITIKLSSTTDDRARGASLFKVQDVKVKVHALKFAIRDSKHNLLYKTLRPLATGLIKKQISKAIADGIRTGLEYADHHMVDVRNRMNAAHESEDGSRVQVLKEVFSSKSSDTSSVSSGSSSGKHKRNSTFRIAPKRDSMLLPDQGYNKGWIRRQTERDAAAAEGEGWHSKAFSIVPTQA